MANITEGITENTMNSDEVTALIAKLDGEFITGTTDGTPATESSHAHTLGRIPKGIIAVSQDKAGSIYDGPTGHDATDIYIAADVATIAFKIYVF